MWKPWVSHKVSWKSTHWRRPGIAQELVEVRIGRIRRPSLEIVKLECKMCRNRNIGSITIAQRCKKNGNMQRNTWNEQHVVKSGSFRNPNLVPMFDFFYMLWSISWDLYEKSVEENWVCHPLVHWQRKCSVTCIQLYLLNGFVWK
jgi:hypothetical protein